MGARQKLNGNYFLGSLILACVVGWLTASVTAGAICLIVLIGLSVNNGDIRLDRRHRR